MRVVVLGGAGAMGRVTVRDLLETSEASVVVADYDVAGAERVASGHPCATAACADVTDAEGTRRLLEGAFAVVNAVQYHHNEAVMRAALAAGCHYVDLGGLFHVTRRQLAMHDAFRERGLLALLGMGAAPGTTNLLALLAAERVGEVREIHVRVASAETGSGGGDLDPGYSLHTVLEETSLSAAVVRNGALEFVPPLTPAGEGSFPPPVGECHPVLTLHSEVATLPARFPGLRECSFGIDFGAALTDRLRFLRDLGVNSVEPVQVGEASVVPQQVLLALLLRRGPAPPRKPVPQHEILRVIARGSGGEAVADCHVTGPSLDIDTGCPPSVAVQMLARGEIAARGALPPEDAVPPEPYFRELARRGMRLEVG